MTWHWPLKNNSPLFPDKAGAFGTRRKHVVHSGVDLYCELGTEVVSVEDGEVIALVGFTGAECQDKSHWWNYTDAIMVRGQSGIVVYGEVTVWNVKVGDQVKGGQTIAIVDTAVLRSFKGRPMVMLHIELLNPSDLSYDAMVASGRWPLDYDGVPPLFKDPTQHLMMSAVELDPIHNTTYSFNLDQYKGEKYRDPTAPEKDSEWWAIWGGKPTLETTP